MKCISYSLFGYGEARKANCFDFNSYLRGLMINIRMNRLIYPGWKNVLHTDAFTFNEFKQLFENISDLEVIVCLDAPLCLAMLWRMMPVFEANKDNTWKYTHVLCRDLDSPTTYREAQAIEAWIQKDTAMHAITDSVSHNLPLMGGMIGINPRYFTERVARSWYEMINKAKDSYHIINWEQKGSDQTFLNQFIYPHVGNKGTESITQHYVLGHGNTFLSDWHNTIPDLELPGVDLEMKESNSVCGHIGAAGFYGPPMFRFLQKHAEKFIDLLAAESHYPTIFHWTQDNTFN